MSPEARSFERPRRILVRPALTDACNAVRIPLRNQNYLFLARKMQDPTHPHAVDFNVLAIFNMHGMQTSVFTPPTPSDISNLEDPRAVLNGTFLGEKTGGEVAIGVTAVTEKSTDINWHLALTTARLDETGSLVPTSELLIIRDFKGKNATPIEWDPISRDITFLARRDDDNKSHELLICKANMETREMKQINTLNIPSLPWNESGIGTVGAPLMINGHNILFIHGRREEIHGDVRKTIYSLGAIEIDNEWQVLGITNKPLIQRSDLPAGELRPDDGRKEAKDVVYSTDNPTLINDSDGNEYVELAVSHGDIQTSIVTIPIENIFSEMQLVLPVGKTYEEVGVQPPLS